MGPSTRDRVSVGYAQGLRHRALAVEGGEVFEGDGIAVALSNLPAAELNAAFVAHPPRDPAGALAAAEAAFRARGHPFFGMELEAGRYPEVFEAARAAGLVRVHSRP